jgi:hypothetical protein
MYKLILNKISLAGLAFLMVMQSCNDKKDNIIPGPSPTDGTFTQGFETLSAAQTQGWIFKYQSDDADYTYPWVSQTVAGAPEGTHALFSLNDYVNNPNSDDIDSAISNWAISPVVWFQNGDSISFYTYSTGRAVSVADRLQLRMTRLDSSSNVGETSFDNGSFTVPLLDINPTLKGAGYPGTWTRYSAVIKGLNEPIQGRFALRHFVPDFYDNGWGVYIDKVTYTSILHH